MSPFMPRDTDKNNDSPRGRRDRPGGGSKGRSGAARGPDKKFAKRGFADKGDGGERKPYAAKPYAAKPDRAKSYDKKPYSGAGKPYAGKREDGRPPRRDFSDAPRPPQFNRDDRPQGDRPPRREFRPREDPARSAPIHRAAIVRTITAMIAPPRGDRDARPASRFSEKKFGDKRPYTPREGGGGEKRPYAPRGEGFRKDGDRPQGDRPFRARPSRDSDRPERKFGGDKKFSRGAPDRSRGPRKEFGDRGDRGPRKDFAGDRGDSKPWQKRDDRGGGEFPPAARRCTQFRQAALPRQTARRPRWRRTSAVFTSARRWPRGPPEIRSAAPAAE